MKLTRIAGECPDKVTCPTVYKTDRGTAVIQGATLIDPEAVGQLDGMPAHESAVEIPWSLWEAKGGS